MVSTTSEYDSTDRNLARADVCRCGVFSIRGSVQKNHIIRFLLGMLPSSKVHAVQYVAIPRTHVRNKTRKIASQRVNYWIRRGGGRDHAARGVCRLHYADGLISALYKSR